MSDLTPPSGDPVVPEPVQPSTPPTPPPPAATPPPPPPPPPPAAPPAGAGASSVDVSAAFSWAIAKFQEHAAILVGLAAVVFGLRAVQQIIGQVLSNTAANNCNQTAITIGQDGTISGGGVSCATGIFANLGVNLLLAIVFGALAWLASIGVYRAALKRSNGETPNFGMLTTGEHLGSYIVVAIVYGIATFAGLILCFLPGIVVIFLFQFAPIFALDKGQGVGEAFGNSYRAVTANFVPVLLAALVNIAAAFLGSILFGLLTLVTLPFAALFTVHIYRQLNKEPIAA